MDFEALTFKATTKLWSVTVATPTNLVVFNVLATSKLSAHQMIPDNIDGVVTDIERSYGYMKEHSKLYEMGYRVMGVIDDDGSERTLVNRINSDGHIDTQHAMNILFDENWLETTWKRISRYEMA